MERAIEIKSTPMLIEMKLKNASLKMSHKNPSFKLTKTEGDFDMKIKEAKIKIDTFDARNSTPFKTPMKSIEEFADRGMQKAKESTANYAREGEQLLDYYVNNNVLSQVAYQKYTRGDNKEFELGYTPSAPIEFEYEAGDISTNYDREKLQFDWKLNELNIDYEPFSFDLVIKQYNEVEINYIAGPQYVPPSADPDYEPIDTYA